jgi:Putative transmembrane protein (PGPGW)
MTRKILSSSRAPAPPATWAPRKYPDVPPLSPSARILLTILGWILIVLGLIGLVLPALQGAVTLILGAATLSLVSRSMLNALRYLFRPWPKGWRIVLRTRRRVQYWIGHKGPDRRRGRPES